MDTEESWLVYRSNRQKGPYSRQQIEELARKGELEPEDWINKKNPDHWIKAAEVPGLFDDLP